MTERPTPETDARIQSRGSPFACVPIDFARRLERERDEARAKLDATCSQESFNDLVRQRTELITERDALREALRELAFSAETSGGTAGRDEHLCAAIAKARSLLGEAT